MNTQRFCLSDGWKRNDFPYNYHFVGLINLISKLTEYDWVTIKKDNEAILSGTMIEIGSYMGESTMMFASSGIFKTIHSIEPHQGAELFNETNGYDWSDVEREYIINTRYFDNIIHHKDYSYNISEEFEDNSIDFIYIDADHTYESVNRDLKLYLPKLKPNGWIGGHDYNKNQWPGVVKAINENIGKPQHIFKDTSWLSKHKTQLL
jgi:cephalosporin hydroxylase